MLFNEGRKEEMKYTRKMGVFEVVDEKECCRSRLVCREIKKARDRDEQLGPGDVFSPMPPSEGLKMLVSTMMTGSDAENLADDPFEMAT